MSRRMLIRIVIGLVVLVAGFFLSLAVRSALARRPTDLGLKDGRLRPCPNSPNCVCTQDTDAQHAIAPLRYEGTEEEALARLKRVIAAMPRTQIVTENEHYLHVEFTTLVMRFVDDVEFVVQPATKTIQFRSASRVGHSDLGVNRRRMEAVRAAFEQ